MMFCGLAFASDQTNITNIPDEWGRIPILLYHNIGPYEYRWTRSVANFKKDLLWLYNNDYVLLSIEDYANNYFPIPQGKKPVILTFDDGKPNQFNMNKDGTIDPNSAIGILDDFNKQYPDFGTAAAFYVYDNPFGQNAFLEKKLAYLWQTGRQIGYHTLRHTNLRGLLPKTVIAILQAQKDKLSKVMPIDMQMYTLAYPHGGVPWGDLTQLMPMIKVGLLIGSDPAYPLYHPKAKVFRTPRIQAIDSEWLRFFGRKSGETDRSLKKEKFRVFVSDGDPGKRTPDKE